MMIEETWMQPYLAYMINKTLPEDTVEAKRIIQQSKAFVVLQGKLYEKYNMHLATICHSSRRAKNLKGYPRRSVWTSR
jgi:hypothetical protein